MSKLASAAEGCLVAVCAHLALSYGRDENAQVWLDVLRDVLPDCQNCPLSLATLRTSARLLVEARPGVARDSAMARLKIEVRDYYTAVAAHRHGKWQDWSQSVIVEVSA